MTLGQTQELVRQSGGPSLAELVERFKDAPDCIEVSGRIDRPAPRSEPRPGAVAKASDGSHLCVTWPTLP